MDNFYATAHKILCKHIKCKPYQFVTPENIKALIESALEVSPSDEELLFLQDYVENLSPIECDSRVLEQAKEGDKEFEKPCMEPNNKVGSDVYFVVQGARISARVAACTFTDYGKVLYDLHIDTGLLDKGDTIETTIYKVDSFFVVPREGGLKEIEKRFPEFKEVATL